MNEVKMAAGYIRVSTAEQSTKGLSIETQIAEIKAYAEYHKMKLVDIYVDRGITARKSLERRIEFMRMMGDVQSGKINHIIVLRLDRFFRNVFDYHKMMNEYLTPNNCDWSAVKEQYTTTTTNGRLMINLRLSIAEQECDTDSDRIKDVFANQVKNGYAISGSLPWGFKIENRRVIVDPEKREIFEDMLNYVELSNSVTATQKYMANTHGVYFNYSSISRLLKNSLLYGSYRGNDNYNEPIMTKERFDNMRRLLDKNIKVCNTPNPYAYIFSGLLICADCGLRMRGTHARNYRYYRCRTAHEQKNCGNSSSISESKIEQYLLDNVERLIQEHIIDVEKLEDKFKPIKSNRKAIEKKLQKLNNLYVNDFIEMDEYKKEYALLQSQIIDEPEYKKKDLTALRNFLESDFKKSYSSLNNMEKRVVWRSIIKEIKAYQKEVVEVIFL